MFTLSPAGFVIQHEQMTPAGLIGREPATVIVSKNLPGQRFDVEAPNRYDDNFPGREFGVPRRMPGRYNLNTLSGDSATIDCFFETGGMGGLPKPLFDIWGGPVAPNAHIKAWVTNTNYVALSITDAFGNAVATTQFAGANPIPTGQLQCFRFAWSHDGQIPAGFQTNWNCAYVDMNGTKPNWVVNIPMWGAWRPYSMLVGADFAGGEFNGIIRRVAISPMIIGP